MSTGGARTESYLRGEARVAVTEPAQALVGSGPFAIGASITESLRIVGVLGAGGMGKVYEAEDVDLQRRVAIKVALSETHAHVLQREAQVLAAIRHPNVVTVHAFGRHDGHSYVVMERLTGRTLRARIGEAARTGVDIPIVEVVDTLAGIADALSTVHRAGLWHRDLKAENVVLSGARVVLVDFGLFSPEGEDGGGVISGTPEYLAPEVLLDSVRPGERASADLYALGVLAYELLIGETPFSSPSPQQTLYRHVAAAIPEVTKLRDDVPQELSTLIRELLAKSPEDRPQASEEVLWRLRAMRADADAAATTPMRVLLVDDDDDLLRALQRALRRALPGLVVDATNDPRRALAAMPHADLAVVDMAMPEMNGVELIMNVAALPRAERPAIVAMSSVASGGDRALVRSLGASYFLPKDDRLVSTLCAIVGERRRAHARGLS